MPNTFSLIASSTVGAGGASSIDFTSTPQTYTDLCIKSSLRNDGGNTVVYVDFNGSTSSFTTRLLYGDGTSPGSVSYSSPDRRASNMVQGTFTASTFSNGEFYIPNYTGSNNKSFSSDSVQENNATLSYSFMFAGLWSNTAAINRVTLTPIAGSFVQYSTAYLYGIKNS